jgi:hypothetical protein
MQSRESEIDNNRLWLLEEIEKLKFLATIDSKPEFRIWAQNCLDVCTSKLESLEAKPLLELPESPT